MIEGCVQWQRIGLKSPQVVADATKEYLEEEDTISLWIEDCCTVGEKKVNGNPDWTSTTDLFASWKEWAEAHGEFVGTSKRFHQKLETLGFTPARSSSGNRGFNGVRRGA